MPSIGLRHPIKPISFSASAEAVRYALLLKESVLLIMEEEIQRLLSTTVGGWWRVRFPRMRSSESSARKNLKQSRLAPSRKRYNRVLEILIDGIAILAGA